MSAFRVAEVGRHLVEIDRPLRSVPRGWSRLWESPAPGGPRVCVGRMWNARLLSLWIRQSP